MRKHDPVLSTKPGLSRLGSFPVIEAKESAQAFTTEDLAIWWNRADFRSDDSILERLVIPFRVIVPEVLSEGTVQSGFAEENHPV